MTGKHSHIRMATLAMCITLAAMLLPLLAAHAAPPTPLPSPPPPPPTPLPSPPPPPPVSQPEFPGGYIVLCVQFPRTWSWDRSHWQDLWTVVQWKDEQGYWREVEGWQGTLDGVTGGESGEVVGKQTWWVARSYLGNGPFRWRVYQGKEGWLLGTSGTFELPVAADDAVTVEVSLAP